MFKVFLLSGSAAKPAHTTSLMKFIANQLEKKGCEVILWDLQEKPLPIVNPEYHHFPEKNPDPLVQDFIKLISKADSFVIGTPNYHNSYSGLLKNALDILNMDYFRNKPVGLVANGGGIRSTQPVDHLRIVIRGLQGVAIPTQVVTSNGDFLFSKETYKLHDESIKGRISSFNNQLLEYTERFK